MKQGRDLPDAEVVRRCRCGEVEAFRVLVERYQDRVYGLAFRLLGGAEDALDAAQEAFVRAYSALDRFDVERPFAPWLLRIAANTCYGILRKRPAGILSLDALAEAGADAVLARGAHEPAALSEDPAAKVVRAEEEEEVRRAVLALPDPYRTVTLLRYMEGLSYEEIAEALEMPLGTVKTCLHRARGRLKKLLGDEGSQARER
jgi:RNA polymerase sigma-70 factor (ECF subfamily)